MGTNIQDFSESFEKIEKRHNTAETSREAFKVLKNEGTLLDQKKSIYNAIAEHGPINSRQLSNIAGLERSSVCRSLFDLLNEINPAIKVAYIKPCPITTRRVKFYSVIDYKCEVISADFTTTEIINEIDASKIKQTEANPSKAKQNEANEASASQITLFQ